MRECPRCERCYDDDVLVCPDDQANTKQSLPGGRLINGRYRLERRLGRGAMGQVYLAQDEKLVTRRVAVKVFRPDIFSDDSQQGARFEREVEVAAALQHPNIVETIDVGKSSDGFLFMVMEYVEGENLSQLLRREGTLALPRTAGILRQVVAALENAHARGFLHRDLKPANILIVQRPTAQEADADEFVKVADFELVKLADSELLVGTPEYMAPEQLQPDEPIDARTDIYALATIAYQMLGGRPPFTGNISQIVAQKMTQAPLPLSSLRSDIPADIDKAVMRGLERDAQNRPATAPEWFDPLDRAIDSQPPQYGISESRIVVLGPPGSEINIDDERRGSIGRSGRVEIAVEPGKHILRVMREGEFDDERVIEVRDDGPEQIIQTQLKGVAPGGEFLGADQPPGESHRAEGSAPTKRELNALVAGDVLQNRYQIVRRLGGSGLGGVYLAQDRNLGGAPRAIKEVSESQIDQTQHEQAIVDFRREALRLVALDHPSIPSIYDFFYDDLLKRFYLVMKFISGDNLSSRLLNSKGMDERTVTEWGIQIADVLHYLHTQSPPIIYRDLKPANLMIDNNNRVMFVDFGMAQWINKTENDVTIVGTMGYAPPELFGGRTEPRSDIYSLGATMFHLLTGTDPQDNPLLIFDFAKNPRPRQINPVLSSGIEQILTRAVDYKPEGRFRSAAEMRDVLAAHLEKLLAVEAPNAEAEQTEPARKTVKAQLKYSCYLSYPHSEAIRPFVDQVYKSLSNELELLNRYPVFDDRNMNFGAALNAGLVDALTESACLIVVYAPTYFDSKYCAREYLAMEELEELRLNLLAPEKKSRSLIIPIIFRGIDRLPAKIKESRQYFDFTDFTSASPDLMKSPQFARSIEQIARQLDESCRAFEEAPEAFVIPEGFLLPTDEEAESFIERVLLGSKPPPPFPIHEKTEVGTELSETIIKRLSPSSRAALLMAESLRSQTNSECLNPEHLLAGLYQKTDGPTHQLLTIFDNSETVYLKLEGLLNQLGPNKNARLVGTLPSTPESLRRLRLSDNAQSVLEKAAELSLSRFAKFESDQIKSRHLLAGLLATEDAVAAQWVANHLGVPQEKLSEALNSTSDLTPPLSLIRSLSTRNLEAEAQPAIDRPQLSRQEALARIQFLWNDLSDLLHLPVQGLVNVVGRHPSLGGIGLGVLGALEEFIGDLTLKTFEPGENLVIELKEPLPFRHVINTCSQTPEGSYTATSVGQAVTRALEKAETLKLDTIALPPIGTEDTSFNFRAIAPAVLEAVTSHLEKGSRLKGITFAFDNEEHYRAYLAAFRQMDGPLSVAVLTPFLSTSARHALALAEALRQRLGREKLSSSQLIWGLYQKEGGAARELLTAAASPEQIESGFQQRLGTVDSLADLAPAADWTLASLRVSPRCDEALVHAAEMAGNASVIRERQLLAGLLSVSGSRGTRWLVELSGISAADLAAITAVNNEEEGEPIGPQVQRLRQSEGYIRTQPWRLNLSGPEVLGQAVQEVRVGEKFTLTLDLVPALPADEAESHLILRIPENSLELTGFIKASGFQMANASRFSIQVSECRPATRNLVLELTPLLSGQRTVEIELYPGSRTAGLTPSSVSRQVRVAAPVVLPDINELIDRRRIPSPQPDVMLYVALEETPAGQRTRIYLTCHALGLDREELNPLPLTESDLFSLRSVAIRAVAASTHLSPRDTLTALRACGAMLFDQLILDDLREHYFDICRLAGLSSRPWTCLIISDDTASLPWELLCAYGLDPETGKHWYDDFLADKFVLAHWVGRRGLRLQNEAPWASLDLVHYDQHLNELPGWCAALGGEDLVQIEDKPGSLSLLQPGSYCYGLHVLRYTDQHRSDQIVAVDDNEDEAGVTRAAADDMTYGQRLDLTLRRPTVGLSFVSTRPPSDLTGFARCDTQLEANWMIPLIHAGASALVGPRWPVSQEADQVFVREFYRAMREGRSLGDAVWIARREVCAAFPHRPDWLAYTYFGHPNCEPYFVRQAQGFTLFEAVNHPDDAPFLAGETYQFRASYRTEAPEWYEGRLRVQQQELLNENLSVMVLPLSGILPETYGLQPIRGSNDLQCTFPLTMPEKATTMPVMVRFQQHEEELRTVMLQLHVKEAV
jgi:serine/threonine protein kinase